MIVGVYDETDKSTNIDVSDWLSSNMQDPIARIPGIGDINVFGSPYAMRIWLDPNKLASFSLMPSDVINAISAQNSEVAAGEIGGQPQPAEQMLNATVTAQSKLQTPDAIPQHHRQVRCVRRKGAAGRCRPRRARRGKLQRVSRVNGHPGAGMALSLAPGADALATADLVKAKVEEISKSFPERLPLRLRQRHDGFHQAVDR